MSCHFQRGFPSCFGLELFVRFDLSLQLPRPLFSPFPFGQNSLQTEVSHSSEEQPAQLHAPAPRPRFCVICWSSLHWHCRDADVQGSTINVGCVLISFTPRKRGVMTFWCSEYHLPSRRGATCCPGAHATRMPRVWSHQDGWRGRTWSHLPKAPGTSLSTTSLGVARRRRNTTSPQRVGSLQWNHSIKTSTAKSTFWEHLVPRHSEHASGRAYICF